jgi:hypothetical protein
MSGHTEAAFPLSGAPKAKLSARMRDKVIYWGSTALVSAAMVYSIINFTFNDHFPPWDPNGPSAFTHLGLPHYFKIELTLAKILGVLALWIPGVPRRVREFAYFGFGLTLLSAVVAHASTGDARISLLFILDPLIFFSLLVASYTYFQKANR